MTHHPLSLHSHHPVSGQSGVCEKVDCHLGTRIAEKLVLWRKEWKEVSHRSLT